MSKVDILRLDSVTTNDTTATATINTNFQNIQAVIDTLLSRTGDTPNYMTAVLDMNSNRIINTAAPEGDLDVVNKAYLDGFVGDIQAKVTEANEAADAALEKAANAASSATYAAVSAQGAQNSARDAEAAAADAAADALAASQTATEIEGYLTDPNLVAVGTDLRKGNDSLIKQVSEMDTAAILQAGADAVQAASDAEDYKEDAEAAAASVAGTDFAVDLSYTNNTLQLIGKDGDPIGTAQAIDALPSQTGQSGKFLTTNGTSALWSNTPAINDSTITITQGGVTKGSFTLNQASGDTIALDAGSGSSYIEGTGIDITNDVISVTSPTLINTATHINSLTIGGTASTYAQSINIGVGSQVNGVCGVAIGRSASANYDSIAIGYVANSTANDAIQLGTGTNSEANSFYVSTSSSNNWKMLGSDGKIPAGRIPISTSVDSTSTNNTVVGAKLFYDTCGDIETLINAL